MTDKTESTLEGLRYEPHLPRGSGDAEYQLINSAGQVVATIDPNMVFDDAADVAEAIVRAVHGESDSEMSVPTGFDKAIEEAMQNKHRDLAQRIRDERRMARALVDACLERGYAISVNDGEEWVLKRSTDKAQIMAALFSTDEDVLMIRTADGAKAGWFHLIYGNTGWDVVSDYSANDVCEAIWNDVLQPLADKIEEGR